MAQPYRGLPDPIQMVNTAATANRINTVNPGGQQTWSPGKNGGPATLTTSLTPTLAGAQKRDDKTYANATGNAAGVLSNPTLNFNKIPGMTVNPGMTGQNAIMSRLAPQIERENAALHTQLTNWGLSPGTEAYNEAMARQAEQKNDLLSRAAIGGIGLDTEAHRQGISDQQAAINTPLNALDIMGGNTSANMGFGGGTAGQTPDVMGAWNAMNKANIAASNNSRQNTTDWLNLGVQGVKAAPDIYDWLKEIWP
jgi:hypothetical protein